MDNVLLFCPSLLFHVTVTVTVRKLSGSVEVFAHVTFVDVPVQTMSRLIDRVSPSTVFVSGPGFTIAVGFSAPFTGHVPPGVANKRSSHFTADSISDCSDNTRDAIWSFRNLVWAALMLVMNEVNATMTTAISAAATTDSAKENPASGSADFWLFLTCTGIATPKCTNELSHEFDRSVGEPGSLKGSPLAAQ